MFALEVNEILQATRAKLRREMGMCGTAAIIIYVQQHYTSTRTRTRASCSLVPGAAYLVPGTHVKPARHAQGTLSILRAFVACCAVVLTAVLVLCRAP